MTWAITGQPAEESQINFARCFGKCRQQPMCNHGSHHITVSCNWAFIYEHAHAPWTSYLKRRAAPELCMTSRCLHKYPAGIEKINLVDHWCWNSPSQPTASTQSPTECAQTCRTTMPNGRVEQQFFNIVAGRGCFCAGNQDACQPCTASYQNSTQAWLETFYCI